MKNLGCCIFFLPSSCIILLFISSSVKMPWEKQFLQSEEFLVKGKANCFWHKVHNEIQKSPSFNRSWKKKGSEIREKGGREKGLAWGKKWKKIFMCDASSSIETASYFCTAWPRPTAYSFHSYVTAFCVKIAMIQFPQDTGPKMKWFHSISY